MGFGGYINVLTKQPGCMYRSVWIKNDLEEFQRLVGGYIEPVTIHGATKDIVVICDEEGRLKDYEPNCTIAGIDFCGPIVVCGVDGEEFADVPYGIEFVAKLTQEAKP